MAELILENPQTGIIKRAPVGFSWTTLFFPSLPALFRGDFVGFIIQLLLNSMFLFPVIIFPFIYNKLYIQKLLEKGFKVASANNITIDEARRRLKINLQQLK